MSDPGWLSPMDEAIGKHIVKDHEATLHPPNQPDRVAIAGTDEDMHLIHSIYFPNCDDDIYRYDEPKKENE